MRTLTFVFAVLLAQEGGWSGSMGSPGSEAPPPDEETGQDTSEGEGSGEVAEGADPVHRATDEAGTDEVPEVEAPRSSSLVVGGVEAGVGPEDEAVGQDLGEGESAAPPLDLSQVSTVPDVTPAQLEWLRPRLGKLPPNPRAHTDYTAYTLDFGEVQLGLTNTRVGLLPRTQVGANLPLTLAGVYNGNVKVNALRAGPVDVAVSGAGYRYLQSEFEAQYWSVGPTVSLALGPHFGVHLGGQYWRVGMEGAFAAAEVHPVLGLADEVGLFPQVAYQGQAASGRLALEWRLNRRDSFVLDAGTMFWMEELPGSKSQVPPMLGAYAGSSGFSPQDSYRVSLAYQMDLKRLSLRAGVGTSQPSGAWLLNTFEASYRFGGKTKAQERRQRRTWRQNRRHARKGEPGAP